MKAFLPACVFALFFACLPSAEANPNSLKLLSYNVYMLPWPIKASLQNERAKSIAQQLRNSNYDVMFFEEAFTNRFRAEMKRVLSATYPYSYYLKRDGKMKHVFGSGLFVMSRKPFRVLDQIYFDKCRVADCYASKGAFIFETEIVSGHPIQFATTHLQAEDGNGDVRLEQLGKIDQLLKKHRRAGVPRILVGDLNIDSQEPEFAEGIAQLKVKPARLTGAIQYTAGRKSACFKTGAKSTTWIDHAWAKLDSGIGLLASRVRQFDFVHETQQGWLTCPDSDHHAIEIRAQIP